MRGKRGTRTAQAWGAHGLGRWGAAFAKWQEERGYSARTLRLTEAYLRYFFAWCEARGIWTPEEVTRPILERYQRHMFLHRKRDGGALTWRSQGQRMRYVQGYFRWLVRQHVLLWNPASDLVLPRQEQRLPKAILTESEVERVLCVPDITTVIGLRDRTLLEVLYGTGMRRLEVVSLKLQDFDWSRCVVWVRQGKGKKDRVLPLGARATSWAERYMRSARGELACGRDEGEFFLTVLGDPMIAEYLTHHVRTLLVSAGIDKPGACHLFRHTMATLMLEGGADVRYVQEMLGHAHMGTTSMYTHVSIRKLQEVHAATHPGAKLARLSGENVAAGVSEPGSTESAEGEGPLHSE
jgi:integrase/recombinase XerD